MKWGVVEEFPAYEISDTGVVRHRESGRVRKLWRESTGYLTVTLRNPGGVSKRLKVHRLVASAFHLNLENRPYVRHLNDVRDDNRLENLAWGTNSENQYDSIRNGTHYGTNLTHCPQGHKYDAENTARRGKRKSRFCRGAMRISIERTV